MTGSPAILPSLLVSHVSSSLHSYHTMNGVNIIFSRSFGGADPESEGSEHRHHNWQLLLIIVALVSAETLAESPINIASRLRAPVFLSQAILHGNGTVTVNVYHDDSSAAPFPSPGLAGLNKLKGCARKDNSRQCVLVDTIETNSHVSLSLTAIIFAGFLHLRHITTFPYFIGLQCHLLLSIIIHFGLEKVMRLSDKMLGTLVEARNGDTNYTDCGHAATTIMKEEGLGGSSRAVHPLFSDLTPNSALRLQRTRFRRWNELVEVTCEPVPSIDQPSSPLGHDDYPNVTPNIQANNKAVGHISPIMSDGEYLTPATKTVKKRLVGSDEPTSLAASHRAWFLNNVKKDERTRELYMGSEEFIEAIAPPNEDYHKIMGRKSLGQMSLGSP
ncbi:hypothetical protein F5Y06DRAFT_308823 [Hypoxylon sp. FL0890]|nr:hypothetical protein F5Y06DRAFT_308823 [Hypoxylon sp. FL0890]